MKHHLFRLISSVVALVLTLRFFSMSPASGPEPVKSGSMSQAPVTVSSVLEEIDASYASSSDCIGPSDLSPVPDDENAVDDPVSSSEEKPDSETELTALSANETSSDLGLSDTASSPASGTSSSLKPMEKKTSTTPKSASKTKEENAKVSERNESNTASVSIVSTAKPTASESTSLSSSVKSTTPSSQAASSNATSSAAASEGSKENISSLSPAAESVPSGHYETVTVTPTWDETVTDSAAWDEPVYTTEWHYYCASCGMDLTAAFGDKVFSDGSHGKSAGACQHIESHYGTSDQVGDYTAPVTVQTDTIHHEAVTHIVHHEAVTEQVWVAQ